jgi:5-methyltetrahydrofolate--homocysteine methyltransferase
MNKNKEQDPMHDLTQLSDAVERGDLDLVTRLTRGLLESGADAGDILDRGLIAAMEVVGVKFKEGELFVPEVLISAKAMHAGLAVLRPLLSASGVKARGRVVMGTVKGDLHDIGKSLVSMMLEGSGFDVIDLGADVPVEKFVATAKEREAHVIGMSALLTTTMPVMKQVIDALRREGLAGKIKVVVGGAPVAQSFADEIGADGYGRDATRAVEVVKGLVQMSKIV